MYGESGFAVIGVLFIMFAILFGAYYVTKLVGTRMISSQRMGNLQKLSLVYRLPLGRDQHLAVVKVASRYLLLGCTSSSITMLIELTEEESEQFTDKINKSELLSFCQFSNILDKLKKEEEMDEKSNQKSDSIEKNEQN